MMIFTWKLWNFMELSIRSECAHSFFLRPGGYTGPLVAQLGRTPHQNPHMAIFCSLKQPSIWPPIFPKPNTLSALPFSLYSYGPARAPERGKPVREKPHMRIFCLLKQNFFTKYFFISHLTFLKKFDIILKKTIFLELLKENT